MDLNSLGRGDVQQYLGDISFPAGKEEVASEAESNGAPQTLVDQIRNAAMEQFSGPQDVLQAVQGSL
ncbi:MAG: DUF2795 domain-containing protein [Actinobacteria bacterium]|nr:DUF2795 domain-containing protein [Actinomycetota bacterium]MCA1738126.1 DUF2795 domain-containing protein [Actinomycetota bacterium]